MDTHFRKPVFLLCVVAILSVTYITQKAHGSAISRREHAEDGLPLFTKHRLSLQLVSGVLFSPFLINTHRPDLDYWQTNLRIGWMLDGPADRKYFFRGNFEGILEITYSDIIKGSGGLIVGATVLFRYNIIYPDAKVIPFIQGGVGVVYTDVYKDESQMLMGQSIEFNPQVSIGARIMVGRNWSIDVEGMFEHISNAGLDDRNQGTNAGGVFIGATYYFDRLWKWEPGDSIFNIQ